MVRRRSKGFIPAGERVYMLDFGFYNMDCMEGMKEFPDKYFDLAVVDPPYFSGPERRGFYGRKISPIGVQRIYEKTERWVYLNEIAEKIGCV